MQERIYWVNHNTQTVGYVESKEAVNYVALGSITISKENYEELIEDKGYSITPPRTITMIDDEVLELAISKCNSAISKAKVFKDYINNPRAEFDKAGLDYIRDLRESVYTQMSAVVRLVAANTKEIK